MTTALLRQIAEQDQADLASRHNGSNVRLYRSAWVIETLRDRLAPEHVSLAKRLMARQAEADGMRPADRERIDGAGNGTETALIGRLDAQREIVGYEAAVRGKLARAGFLAFRGILEGDGFVDLMRRCGFTTSGHAKRSAVELVQITMHTASDYRDECDAQRISWNEGALQGAQITRENGTFQHSRPQP